MMNVRCFEKMVEWWWLHEAMKSVYEGKEQCSMSECYERSDTDYLRPSFLIFFLLDDEGVELLAGP
jgi:hypothetical protein